MNNSVRRSCTAHLVPAGVDLSASMAVRWVELTRAKRSARSVRRIGLTGSVAWDGPHALCRRGIRLVGGEKKIFLGF